MKISVVIPLFNKRRHIQRAVRSVLNQTTGAHELIVVDDGSTDRGGDLVRLMADPRVRLISQENAGVSAARNRGIEAAESELIAFLDADDEWRPGFLETVTGLYRRHPEAGMFATGYLYCSAESVRQPAFVDCPTDPQGGLVDDYFRSAMGPCPVWSSCVMIPKHVLRTVGLFPVGIHRGEDLHLWARIALRYRLAWSPLEGALYHLSADNRACNLTATTTDMAAAAVVEEFLRSGVAPVSPRHTIEEYLICNRIPIALECHLNGRKAQARILADQIRGTKLFKNKKRILMCLLWMPPRLLRSALALKAGLRHAWRGSAQLLSSFRAFMRMPS